MKKYTLKQPVEAVQWTGENLPEITEFLNQRQLHWPGCDYPLTAWLDANGKAYLGGSVHDWGEPLLKDCYLVATRKSELAVLWHGSFEALFTDTPGEPEAHSVDLKDEPQMVDIDPPDGYEGAPFSVTPRKDGDRYHFTINSGKYIETASLTPDDECAKSPRGFTVRWRKPDEGKSTAGTATNINIMGDLIDKEKAEQLITDKLPEAYAKDKLTQKRKPLKVEAGNNATPWMQVSRVLLNGEEIERCVFADEAAGVVRHFMAGCPPDKLPIDSRIIEYTRKAVFLERRGEVVVQLYSDFNTENLLETIEKVGGVSPPGWVDNPFAGIVMPESEIHTDPLKLAADVTEGKHQPSDIPLRAKPVWEDKTDYSESEIDDAMAAIRSMSR